MKKPIYLALLTAAILFSQLGYSRAHSKNLHAHAKLSSLVTSHADGKHPRVLYFYARWAEPCKRMESKLKQSIQPFADKVDFEAYDVDDEANAAVISKYQVSPIPTVLYLDKSGKVARMNIGY